MDEFSGMPPLSAKAALEQAASWTKRWVETWFLRKVGNQTFTGTLSVTDALSAPAITGTTSVTSPTVTGSTAVITPEIRAAGAAGIRIEDDGDNLAAKIIDGGYLAADEVLYVDRPAGDLTHYAYVLSRGSAASGNFGNAAGNGQGEIASVGLSGLVVGTYDATPLILGTSNSERTRITSGGFLGHGVTVPYGHIHAYDGKGGFMAHTGTWVSGTNTVIPNGTGDVQYALRLTSIARTSGGSVQTGDGLVLVGATTDLYNAGGNILRLSVNADGSVTITRTSGSEAWDYSLLMHWL